MDSSNSEGQSSQKSFCKLCNAKFAFPSGLWKHNKRKHPDVIPAPVRQPSLPCGLCNALFLLQVDICKHVSEVHSIKADVKDTEFESMDDFRTWKKAQEEKGKCLFANRKNKPLADGTRLDYYYCHRSGEFKSESKGIRAPRHHVTNRSGFQCSAFMISKINADGHISVSYCTDHYGHDHLLSRLPLPDSTREQVKTLLIQERNPDFIVKTAQGNFLLHTQSVVLTFPLFRKFQRDGLSHPWPNVEKIGHL